MALATDATPSQLGWADSGIEVAPPLGRQLPIYAAELLAAPRGATIYIDNTAALVSVCKGRCPAPWLPVMSHWFAWLPAMPHGFSGVSVSVFRYIPSAANPAEEPSRWPK